MLDKEQKKFLKKCQIYFDETNPLTKDRDLKNFLSGEKILQNFMNFWCRNDKKVKLGLHTGSICFDAMTLFCAIMGSIARNTLSNEEIVDGLKEGDMIIFQGRRCRWLGVKEDNGRKWAVTEEDGKKKDGPVRTETPYEIAKNKIAPYRGASRSTGTKGLRLKKTNREDFLANFLGAEVDDVPAEFDFVLVILASGEYFERLSRGIWVQYNGKKKIRISDLLIPAIYVTREGMQYQLGENPTKSSPNIIVTERTSMMRRAMFRIENCNSIVFREPYRADGYSELDDILESKRTGRVWVSAGIFSGLTKHIIETCEKVDVFTVDEETVKTIGLTKREIKMDKGHSEIGKMRYQLQNLAFRKVETLTVSSSFDGKSYYDLRTRIAHIEMDEVEKNEFQRNAFSLLKFLTLAFFPMKEYEERAKTKGWHSPKERLEELKRIAEASESQDAIWVVGKLEQFYQAIFRENTKEKELYRVLKKFRGSRTTFVLPDNEGFRTMFCRMVSKNKIKGARAIYVRDIKPGNVYGPLVVVGNIRSRQFEPVSFLESNKVVVMMYDFEEKMFMIREKMVRKILRMQRARREGRTLDEASKLPRGIITKTEERTLSEENDIEYEMARMSRAMRVQAFDRKMIMGRELYKVDISTAAILEDNKIIFFSENYEAVIYDEENGSVKTKRINEIKNGDRLVIRENNEYTKNIVDYIFEELLELGKMPEGTRENFEKSRYWKKKLREFKQDSNYTYDEMRRAFSRAGGEVVVSTIIQWLSLESHIVGPRKAETMRLIARVIGDEKMKEEAREYFEACNMVRKQRREILKLVAIAIRNKLSGKKPQEGDMLEVVYNNIEKISKIYQIKQVVKAKEPVSGTRDRVNRILEWSGGENE